MTQENEMGGLLFTPRGSSLMTNKKELISGNEYDWCAAFRFPLNANFAKANTAMVGAILSWVSY
jgi:hypothetical protein